MKSNHWNFRFFQLYLVLVQFVTFGIFPLINVQRFADLFWCTSTLMTYLVHSSFFLWRKSCFTFRYFEENNILWIFLRKLSSGLRKQLHTEIVCHWKLKPWWLNNLLDKYSLFVPRHTMNHKVIFLMFHKFYLVFLPYYFCTCFP